jgi:hypothetical protein
MNERPRVSAIDLVWLAAYTGVCCGGAAGCAPSRIAHCCVPCLPAALQACPSVVVLSMELHAQEWGTNPWPLTRALLGDSQQPEVPSGSFLMLWDAASTVLELDTGQHNPNARMCCLKDGRACLAAFGLGGLATMFVLHVTPAACASGLVKRPVSHSKPQAVMLGAAALMDTPGCCWTSLGLLGLDWCHSASQCLPAMFASMSNIARV